MPGFVLRSLTDADHDWVCRIVAEYCGGDPVITPDGAYVVRDLPGYVADEEGTRVGLAQYRVAAGDCELITLASLRCGRGIGSALVAAVRAVAARAGCRRLRVCTSNDNLNALGFYQKRGFVLARLHRGAMERVRQAKPGVPFVGAAGVPLRDIIELEMALDDRQSSASAGYRADCCGDTL
jgi:GNAT superfamily N-acetyltransferase